jgi:hypothetical protein
MNSNLINRFLYFFAFVGTIIGWPSLSLIGLRLSFENLKNNYFYLFLFFLGFCLCTVLGDMDLLRAIPWLLILFLLFLPFVRADVDLYKLKSQEKFVYLYIILIVIIGLVLIFKDGHLIIGLDKNIFTIPLLVIYLVIYRIKKHNFIIIALMLMGSFATGSLNFFLSIILLIVGGQFFKKPASMFTLVLSSFAAFSVSTIAVLYSAMKFDFYNPESIFAVASVIERGIAYFNAIDFIANNDLFFNGGFVDYADSVVTRVHNDYIQILIRNGFIFFTLFYVFTLVSFSRLNLTASDVFVIIFFSSNLGLIGWLSGLFFFVFYLIALNVVSSIADLKIIK